MRLEKYWNMVGWELRNRPRTLPDPQTPISGETGQDVMKRLGKVYTDAFYTGERKRKAVKVESIYTALPSITVDGEYAQFGVFKGLTARFLTPYVPTSRRLHLFDSFVGLPEKWNEKFGEGHFSLDGQIPRLDLNICEIHKGWFSETVPPFAASSSDPMAFMHMDADLYSSTMDVLVPLNDRIVAGTILLFDEYVLGSEEQEHRALIDWSSKFEREFEYLWRTNWVQVAVRVTK